MKKLILLTLSLLLTACYSSPLLPDKKRELSGFIPKEVLKATILPEKKEFDFVTKNFPEKCEWQKYVRTVDGDTIVVDKKTRVRFIGIDTPEIKHPEKPLQPFGPEASEKTKSLLKNSEKVCLIADSIGDKIDTYNRQLAYIFTETGADVNAELLLSGLAKGYYWFDFERKEEFRQYEEEAKKKKVGVWKKQ